MLLLFVRQCEKLGPQKFNFDVSLKAGVQLTVVHEATFQGIQISDFPHHSHNRITI